MIGTFLTFDVACLVFTLTLLVVAMAVLCQSPLNLKLITSSSSSSSSNRNPSFRLNLSRTEPPPIFTSVKSFAPATVANLGPGFNFLGCAVDGIDDFVTLCLDPDDFVTLCLDPDVHPGEVSISDISGARKKLRRNPLWNCTGIAAISIMKKLNIRSVGLSLSLHKGLPLGSGLGSSAASAAAAALAVNEIFGRPLTLTDLVLDGLESESKVSGYHAYNVS